MKQQLDEMQYRNTENQVKLSSRMETETIFNQIREEAQNRIKEWDIERQNLKLTYDKRRQELMERNEVKVKELEQKCEDLGIQLKCAREKLKEAEKSKGIIYNYKELIESINNLKEKLIYELENSEERVQKLLRITVFI